MNTLDINISRLQSRSLIHAYNIFSCLCQSPFFSRCFFLVKKKCAILTEPEWLADQHGEWFIFIIHRITMIAWLDRRIYWSPLTKRRSYLRAWKTGTDKLFSYINFTSLDSVSFCNVVCYSVTKWTYKIKFTFVWNFLLTSQWFAQKYPYQSTWHDR